MPSNLSISPIVLVRISNNSIDSFSDFSGSLLIHKVEQFNAHKLFLEEKKLKLCDSIHDLISMQNDGKVQNFLLNYKRAIYKNKVKNLDLNSFYNFCPALKCDMSEYINGLNAFDDFILKFEREYEYVLSEKRTILIGLSKDDSFQNALLLSSQQLFEACGKYFQSKTVIHNKRFSAAEKSVLKYITRMYTKTSPFSSFTNVGICHLEDTTKRVEDSDNVRSSIRINNYILKIILDIMTSNPEINLALPLRLNPTLEVDNKIYSFLVSTQTAESFQKIHTNPILDQIFHQLTKQRLMIFSDLVKFVLKMADASADSVAKYISQLISYGFIEFKINISGMDACWDEKLLNILQEKSLDTIPAIKSLHSIVTLLNDGKTALQSTGNINERNNILSGVNSDLKHKTENLISSIQINKQEDFIEEGKFILKSNVPALFNTKNIYYEDTTRVIDYAINQSWLEAKIKKLDELLEELSVFDVPLLHRRKLVKYFKYKYPENARVDFLRFYEDYFKDIERNPTESRPINVLQDELVAIKKKLVEDLSMDLATLNSSGETSISIKSVKERTKNIGIKFNEENRNSRSCFFQIVNHDEKKLILINMMAVGFGRMFSRFLHLFDDDATEILKKTNAGLSEDDLFIENCDGSFFNANIHPLLMPFEITVPNSNNTAELSEQIAIKDLEVRIIGDDVALYHKSLNKRAYMFDIGFQGIGRSQIFQLLNFFTLPHKVNFQPIIEAHETYILKQNNISSFETSEKVILIPRLVFEDDIVLQRKTWIVPSGAIPQKGLETADFQYFIEINTWLISNNIPSEVFVILNANRFDNNAQNDNRKQLSKDDYKPQYINFSNPLLLNLFIDMISKPFKYLKIEETLPGLIDLEKFSNKKHVSEFLAQWENN